MPLDVGAVLLLRQDQGGLDYSSCRLHAQRRWPRRIPLGLLRRILQGGEEGGARWHTEVVPRVRRARHEDAKAKEEGEGEGAAGFSEASEVSGEGEGEEVGEVGEGSRGTALNLAVSHAYRHTRTYHISYHCIS